MVGVGSVRDFVPQVVRVMWRSALQAQRLSTRTKVSFKSAVGTVGIVVG